jgi:hypothetical protein
MGVKSVKNRRHDLFLEGRAPSRPIFQATTERGPPSFDVGSWMFNVRLLPFRQSML